MKVCTCGSSTEKPEKSIQKAIIVYILKSCPPRPVYVSTTRGITGIVMEDTFTVFYYDYFLAFYNC